MTFFFTIFAFALIPIASKACLYNTEINELILEETVPVCFIGVPSYAETDEQMIILKAMRDIKQSLENLDKATILNFSGYARCKPHSGKPEIRISLDKTNATASAVTKPGYSTNDINVYLPTFIHNGNKSDAKVQTASHPVPTDTYQWMAKHEVLHLFGLQHDHRIANVSLEKLKSRNPSIRALPDPNNPDQPRAIDLTSIMNLNNEDLGYQQNNSPSSKIPQGKLLNELDIQCINSIVTEARSTKNSSIPSRRTVPVELIPKNRPQDRTRATQ